MAEFQQRSAPTSLAPQSGPPQAGPQRGDLQGQGYDDQRAALKPGERKTTMMQDIALDQATNDRERAILGADADAASAWVQAAAWAIGISGTYAATRPEGSAYLGRADALRHTLWNAYMAFTLGEERAKALADAHEDPVRPSSGNSAKDREMDLRNNATGRMLGVTCRESGVVARALGLTFIAAAALTYLNDGSLWVVDQRDANNWQLVPSNTEGVP